MRLILLDLDVPSRRNFYPIALSRPIFDMRIGMGSLGEKLIARIAPTDVACFVPDYMADVVRERTGGTVNDPGSLAGDDLVLVDGRIKAHEFSPPSEGGSSVAVDDDGNLVCARIAKDDLAKLDTGSIEALCASAARQLEKVDAPARWQYVWDLVLENPEQIAMDFKAAGRSGIEGTVEEPNAIRGSRDDVFIARGAEVHPMVVLDASEGPIYLDEDVEVQPFTRIEGPCYVGKKSMLLAAKCREGMSIGPVCRVGGEVEESLIHGYSNKYHDGFLGHAYVGEWVNLGAMTTNSDLKNDYGPVAVSLDGGKPIDTGSTKVGSMIGDHVKTSIGVLLNTGAYVGGMSLIVAHGKPLPKYIPEFSWMIDGIVTKGFGRKKLYETAKAAMPRRKKAWTDTEQAMWEAIFEMTAPQRNPMIDRGKRQMLRGT